MLLFTKLHGIVDVVTPGEVRRGEVLAYDSVGRLVKITAFFGFISVLSAEADPGHAADLRILLSKYLIDHNVEPSRVDSASLAELIDETFKHGNSYWQEGVDYPIFVWEPGDVHMYSNPEDLRNALEAVDVDDGLYKAVDKTGRALKISSIAGKISVTALDHRPADTDALRNLLVGSLSKHGIANGWLSAASLADLVSKYAESFEG